MFHPLRGHGKRGRKSPGRRHTTQNPKKGGWKVAVQGDRILEEVNAEDDTPTHVQPYARIVDNLQIADVCVCVCEWV